MPENTQHPKVFSLLEITESIQRAFQKWYSGAYWIKAEMNKLNFYKYSGHCYPDLLERQDGKVVAQIRATLWNTDFNRVNAQFLQVLKEPLKDGINILFLAKVTFNPVHGLSLSILDIDPAYTLGDLEREKLETISRLKLEGIFDQNKRIPIALVPQRIAIISVETSKGLADFYKMITANKWGYRFFTLLFPALLQGDKAPESIIRQLKRISKVLHHFDAVAIVRGGGGEVGLASYNNYELARVVATFPIPVITGIGHSTNETVVEMVSHTNAITPTELAGFLIQMFHNFAVPLYEAKKVILNNTRQIIGFEKQRLADQSLHFKSATTRSLMLKHEIFNRNTIQIKQNIKNTVKEKKVQLAITTSGIKKHPQAVIDQNEKQLFQQDALLKKSALQYCKRKLTELAAIIKQVSLVHPENVLKRGYSITLFNGKSMTASSDVRTGDDIETILFKGKIKSKVLITSNKIENHE